MCFWLDQELLELAAGENLDFNDALVGFHLGNDVAAPDRGARLDAPGDQGARRSAPSLGIRKLAMAKVQSSISNHDQPAARIQMAHAKLQSPMARNSKGRRNRILRLSHVGQVPHSFCTNGLSAPPTTPR
jgi:hypothetical protein